jgi:TDG/mug DNA glycosylase family protein
MVPPPGRGDHGAAGGGDGGEVLHRFATLAPTAVPAALADLQVALPVGAQVRLELPTSLGRDRAIDVVEGAGFVDPVLTAATSGDTDSQMVRAVRARTLPDQVAPFLRLLICGLNPSLYAADRGVGFARPGNRFWPAALAAGIASRPLDPQWLRTVDRVGMTDLVKRATAGAAELTAAEYRDGVHRLERLVRWLQPGVICFVGLAGWRAAVNRRAVAGPIEDGFGGRPAYLMANTSGLNASSRLDDLTAHLRAAATLASPPGAVASRGQSRIAPG